MDPGDVDMIKLLGSGGFGAALLGLVAWVGRRLVRSMDEHKQATTASLGALGDKVDANTAATTKAVGELRTDLAVLGARVEVWSDTGPVNIPVEESRDSPTARHGRPPGIYGIRPR